MLSRVEVNFHALEFQGFWILEWPWMVTKFSVGRRRTHGVFTIENSQVL